MALLSSGDMPKDVSEKILSWAFPIDRELFCRIYAALECAQEWKSPHKRGKRKKKDDGYRSWVVGRVFEHLLRALFADEGAVRVVENLESTTNEIDLVLKIEPAGSAVPILREAGSIMIAEAKCHQKAPNSTLVNGFSTLLQTHNATHGILFVFCTKRKLQAKVRQAIALSWAYGRCIVPIGREQLEAVRDGACFGRVLVDQFDLARTHTTSLTV